MADMSSSGRIKTYASEADGMELDIVFLTPMVSFSYVLRQR